jgi:DNA repair protein RadC
MKEMAPYDRPREKLERLGASSLGDNELLALVIGVGSRDADALALANRLLAASGGVHALTRLGLGQLRAVAGIGRARASQVMAAVELGRRTLMREVGERARLRTPRDIAATLLPQYGSHPVEQFGIVMLDTKQRLIRIKILSLGSLDSTVVHPREVFREATAASAASIILFHNHPSGDPTPSESDFEITRRMVDAGKIVGIDVLDHFVLADRSFCAIRAVTKTPWQE